MSIPARVNDEAIDKLLDQAARKLRVSRVEVVRRALIDYIPYKVLVTPEEAARQSAAVANEPDDWWQDLYSEEAYREWKA